MKKLVDRLVRRMSSLAFRGKVLSAAFLTKLQQLQGSYEINTAKRKKKNMFSFTSRDFEPIIQRRQCS
jgi:hypothetical protein